MRVKYVLPLVLILFAGDAFAECVSCMQTSCIVVRPGGASEPFDGIVCGWSDPNGSGPEYNGFRTVGECNGCLGFTCYKQQTPNAVPVRIGSVKIERELPATAEEPPSPSK